MKYVPEPRDATVRLVIKISAREDPFDRYHMAVALRFGASWWYELSIRMIEVSANSKTRDKYANNVFFYIKLMILKN